MYRSKKPMKPKLTNRSIRYIIGELKKSKSTKMLSEEINVTQRHVQRLQAEYVRTKTVHIQRPVGRLKSNGPSDEEIKIVLLSLLEKYMMVHVMRPSPRFSLGVVVFPFILKTLDLNKLMN